MSEQKRLKKQLYKNMIYIYIVFVILFLLFDVILYNKISNSLYEGIDKEIFQEVERYRSGKLVISEHESKKEETEKDSQREITPEHIQPERGMFNPRIIHIIRDENGDVVNQNSIGRIYEYITDIEFDKDHLDKAYTIKVEDQYNYRGITFVSYDVEGATRYIQFLANVDGEIQVLNNLLITLAIGTGVIVIVSIIASYVLSARALSPIVESWKKQTEFVQNASHELRTPLTIIQAKQELLLKYPNDKIIDKSEDINISINETRRLVKLIKDLMILARSDSNELVLDKTKVNIDKMIDNIVSPYIDFAELENKTVETVLNYGKEIDIDQGKISQLIVILLDNAIKYTNSGERIEIKTYEKDNKLFIEVSDNGTGMSKEGIEHAFDRFYREDKARTRKTGGSGLGLSIAYMITKLHGGSIKIESNQPKGTKVIVRI